jgi:hypothetical protein
LLSDAVQDAANIDSARNLLCANHRKIFLMKAFGINPDGTPIKDQGLLPDCSVQYCSVKSDKQYKKMVHILSNWGDDAVLVIPEDDPNVNIISKFWHKHKAMGYTYARDGCVQDMESLDGIPMKLLIHCRTGGIVVDMLTIFDVMWEAHQRIGHLAMTRPMTHARKLTTVQHTRWSRFFCEGCYVCLEKQPKVPPCKDAKKPIISSHFRDCFQVDLIDMRSRRKKDVYG